MLYMCHLRLPIGFEIKELGEKEIIFAISIISIKHFTSATL